MNHQEMFGKAVWLTPGPTTDTPYLRTVFNAPETAKAVLTVCGLGFYELYLNDTRVSEDLFVTLSSYYHANPNAPAEAEFGERMGSRVYCMRYDVTALLKSGKNALCAALSPGWYTAVDRYGDVKFCYRLEFLDSSGRKTGEVFSEKGKWIQGPVVKCDFFFGETQDAALEIEHWSAADFDDSGWRDCAVAEMPQTDYAYCDCPTDRIIRTVKPTLISENGQYRLYDVGENITGYAVVSCSSEEPTEITLRYGEEIGRLTGENDGAYKEAGDAAMDKTLPSDSGLDPRHTYGQASTFRTAGVPGTFHTRFTWNGFRYVEVSKNAEVSSVAVIHSNVPVTSALKISDPTLQWIYDAYVRTQLCNMHAGIPSDCPHIERRGYTGDGQLTCETGMLLFGAHDFYRKWIRDISDCQDRVSGHVQYTAPYTRCGGGPGGWGCAIVEVPYVYYRTYGEIEPFTELYPQMLRYFDYLDDHSENDLVVSDQPGCWCLGDWLPPSNKAMIPEPFVNNYFYVKSVRRLLEMAPLIGCEDDLPALREREQRLIAAMEKNYFDPATGDFCGNVQMANCFAVDLGLGDERTFANLVKACTELGRYDTGIFATDILTRLLFEKGKPKLAYKLLTSKDPTASFFHWKEQGATTLWECWNGERSHSHPMFGAVARYFFYYILGIRQTDDSAGYRKLLIKPWLGDEVGKYKGTLQTVSGKITVELSSYMSTGEFLVTLDGSFEAELDLNGSRIPLKKGKNRFRF